MEQTQPARSRVGMAVIAMATAGLLSALSGCYDEGIGAPCLPTQPAPTAGQTCDGQGCFLSSEVYIESRSLSCQTRVCMVYQWDQFGTMGNAEERSKRVFCTRQCSVERPCSVGFSCVPVFNTGDRGLRGSFCVRRSIAPAQYLNAPGSGPEK